MSDIFDDFFKFDSDDPFGMKKWDKEMEEMEVQGYIARFKSEKKEPIEKRRDILLEIMHKQLVEAVKETLDGLDTDKDIESIDEIIKKKVDYYIEDVNHVNVYYNKKLKEIDDMKVKVVRKSKES